MCVGELNRKECKLVVRRCVHCYFSLSIMLAKTLHVYVCGVSIEAQCTVEIGTDSICSMA